MRKRILPVLGVLGFLVFVAGYFVSFTLPCGKVVPVLSQEALDRYEADPEWKVSQRWGGVKAKRRLSLEERLLRNKRAALAVGLYVGGLAGIVPWLIARNL